MLLCLFTTGLLIPNPRSSPRQKYMGPRLNFKKLTHEFCQPFSNFTSGEEVRNLASIFASVAYESPWFRNGATRLKSKHLLSTDDWSKFGTT